MVYGIWYLHSKVRLSTQAYWIAGRYGLPGSSKSVYKANVLSVNSAKTSLRRFVIYNVIHKIANGALWISLNLIKRGNNAMHITKRLAHRNSIESMESLWDVFVTFCRLLVYELIRLKLKWPVSFVGHFHSELQEKKLKITPVRAARIFSRRGGNLKITLVRRVIWSKIHTEIPRVFRRQSIKFALATRRVVFVQPYFMGRVEVSIHYHV